MQTRPIRSTPADPQELSAWLRLTATRGIGPLTGQRLLAAFGLPIKLFDASASRLRAVCAGLPNGARIASALEQHDPEREREVARALQWVGAADSVPRAIVTLADPGYPPRLLHLADPPLLLFVEGAVQALSVPQIAIVGSRNATPSGIATARDLAGALVRAGWAITSGLAEGIDHAAHLGALSGALSSALSGEPGGSPGGALNPAGVNRTVAVMGTGIDRIYPMRHRQLAQDVAIHGALVSEQPVGSAPHAAHFPRRNRLIAALADGVVVVEAALRSGSLITARAALDVGREVFAVPGSIHSPQSRGCHWLIRQGACLTEDVADIVQALVPTRSIDSISGRSNALDPVPGDVSAARDPRSNEAGQPLLAALAGGPLTVDALQAGTGIPVAHLLASLQKLEIEGRVEMGADGRWYRHP